MATEKILADILSSPQSSLASSNSTSTSFSSNVSPTIWHSPEWVTGTDAIHDWSETTKKENKKLQALLNLLEYSSTPSINEFSTGFENVVQQASYSVSTGTSSNSEPNVSPQFQLALTERVLSEDRYWPKEQLNTLIKLQWIPYSHLSPLCTACMEKKDENLLKSLVAHHSHLPECVIVNILKFFISSCGSGISNDSHKDTILRLLSLKYNDTSLTRELKSFDIKECLVLLKFLFHLLRENNFISKQPTFVQVVDWTCALVDAQFSSLVVCQEAERLVFYLRATVYKQLILLDKMSIFDECLRQIALKRTIHQDQGRYTIETYSIQFD